MKAVVISGSSRPDGDTIKMVEQFLRITEWGHVELGKYEISHYDYDHTNKDDDFLPLIRKVISEYEIFILATPVYWYSMSGLMKVFFDRLTDLLTIEKDLGRSLRGKFMAALATSNSASIDNEFWLPFKKSAEYLGMTYLGNQHSFGGDLSAKDITKFVTVIDNAAHQKF